jgi:hypothetical protein
MSAQATLPCALQMRKGVKKFRKILAKEEKVEIKITIKIIIFL